MIPNLSGIQQDWRTASLIGARNNSRGPVSLPALPSIEQDDSGAVLIPLSYKSITYSNLHVYIVGLEKVWHQGKTRSNLSWTVDHP
jgi:hypothetical protein